MAERTLGNRTLAQEPDHRLAVPERPCCLHRTPLDTGILEVRCRGLPSKLTEIILAGERERVSECFRRVWGVLSIAYVHGRV